jgi:isoleucyl-tRNA synthetase
VRTRQPLGRALVAAAGWRDLPEELRLEIADELNVGTVDELSDTGDGFVDYQVKPNFRELGRRFGGRTPRAAEAIGAADPAEMAAVLRTSGRVTLTVDGIGRVVLWPDDVVVTERPRAGWAVESAAGETVALDLTLTPELRRAGLTREVIRMVQEARKAEGLRISDRIELWWHTEAAELATALREGETDLAAEVLADGLYEGRPPAALPPHRHQEGELSLTFWLRRAR